jgi:S1-C subfamily serine protease
MTDRPSQPGTGDAWGAPVRSKPTAGQRVRQVVFGSERRLGIWILPLFLMTALLGATMAGGLAVLYYGQRVNTLESTTAAARAQLDAVSEDVSQTAESATAAIEEQVRQVRESLAAGLPIGAPNDVGVFAVSARHENGEVRVGSAFTIYSDSSESFLVTNYRVVATEDGWAVRGAEVFLPERTVAAVVHNFDRTLDVAVLVVRGGPLPVLPWRPGDQAITRGDALYAAGIAGPGTAAVAEGKVAGVSGAALVPSMPLNEFVGGGPLLDASGQVVGIASLDYAPFGRVAGPMSYAVPIRAVCRRLVRCTAADMAADALGEQGGGDAAGRPREPAPPPTEGEQSGTPQSPPPTASPTPAEPPPVDGGDPAAPSPSPSPSPSP